MRVAALYDVHGNAPALETVLAEVEREGIDLVVFGGDLSVGLLPRETIELARAVPNARFVRGNADRYLIEMVDGAAESPSPLVDAWSVAQVDRRDRDFLASFERTVVVDDVLYCHATPHEDEPLITSATPEQRVRSLLGDVEQRIVVCGHTHMQFDRVVDSTRVVNAGSLGFPFGTTDACWALVVDGEPQLRRTRYDLDAARARLSASGHSLRERLVEQTVSSPRSEEDMIAFYEGQAVALS